MPIGGELGALLGGFNEQSPINVLAMIAQAGLQQPELLAKLAAQVGAPVPTNIPPAGPTVGALAQQAQTIGPGVAGQGNTFQDILRPDQVAQPA